MYWGGSLGPPKGSARGGGYLARYALMARHPEATDDVASNRQPPGSSPAPLQVARGLLMFARAAVSVNVRALAPLATRALRSTSASTTIRAASAIPNALSSSGPNASRSLRVAYRRASTTRASAAAAAAAPAAMTSVTDFIETFNADYARIHKTYEDNFWETKMSKTGNSVDALTESFNALETFLGDAAVLEKVRGYLVGPYNGVLHSCLALGPSVSDCVPARKHEESSKGTSGQVREVGWRHTGTWGTDAPWANRRGTLRGRLN